MSHMNYKQIAKKMAGGDSKLEKEIETALKSAWQSGADDMREAIESRAKLVEEEHVEAFDEAVKKGVRWLARDNANEFGEGDDGSRRST